MNSWLINQIKSQGIRRIVLAVVVLGLLALFAFANLRYLKSYFSGPLALTPAEVAALKSHESLPSSWVKFTPEKFIDTGIEEITVRKKRGVERSRSVTGHYYAAVIGGRYVLVDAHDGTPSGEIKGELRPVPGSVRANIEQQLKKDIGVSFDEAFVPVMLDNGNFKSSGDIGLIIGGLLALAALVYGAFAASRVANPQGHPAFARVAPSGVDDIESAKLENELNTEPKTKIGKWTLTRRFAVQKSLLGFDVQRLDELAWAYRVVTQKKLYYVIPLGKSHALTMKWKGTEVKIDAKEAKVDAALEHIATHAPWTLLGFSDELETAWKKRPAEVLAAVAERKRAGAQTL
jgi:hypothetical protein